MKKGYEFDDVLLVPQQSTIDSRSDVDISVQLGYMKLAVPIIASPMRGIISPKMIKHLDKLGTLGILHRFHDDYGEWYKQLRDCSDASNWGAAVGLGNLTYRDAIGMGCSIICVDVANGYLYNVSKYVETIAEFIQKEGSGTMIMAGNVVTRQGANWLSNAGANIIRVGIGSGALCITRQVTGVGVPQLTAIMDCDNSIATSITADGGIRSPGDIVKALAAGADTVMIGSMFAKAYESANGGTIYGMASRWLQEEHYHETKSVEGIEKVVAKSIPLSNLIEELVWGIKSACTYLNAKNLEELQLNAEFIEV